MPTAKAVESGIRETQHHHLREAIFRTAPRGGATRRVGRLPVSSMPLHTEPQLAKKPNYNFEKRKKELDRQQKKEEKRRRKREETARRRQEGEPPAPEEAPSAPE